MKILGFTQNITDNSPLGQYQEFEQYVIECPRSTPQILPRCPRFGPRKYGDPSLADVKFNSVQ